MNFLTHVPLIFYRPIAEVVVQLSSKPPLGSAQCVPNHNFFKAEQPDHSIIKEMLIRLTTRTETVITRHLHEIEQLNGLKEWRIGKIWTHYLK